MVAHTNFDGAYIGNRVRRYGFFLPENGKGKADYTNIVMFYLGFHKNFPKYQKGKAKPLEVRQLWLTLFIPELGSHSIDLSTRGNLK